MLRVGVGHGAASPGWMGRVIGRRRACGSVRSVYGWPLRVRREVLFDARRGRRAAGRVADDGLEERGARPG